MVSIRFSPFRKAAGPAGDLRVPTDPVPASLVRRQIERARPGRKVTIVHPEARDAYLLKARLLNDGHRSVETFFVPESFLTMVDDGHVPDVVFLHDFTDHPGLSGVQLARLLRIEHGFDGLIYSTSSDHEALSHESLGLHGYSGHAEDYFAA